MLQLFLSFLVFTRAEFWINVIASRKKPFSFTEAACATLAYWTTGTMKTWMDERTRWLTNDRKCIYPFVFLLFWWIIARFAHCFWKSLEFFYFFFFFHSLHVSISQCVSDSFFFQWTQVQFDWSYRNGLLKYWIDEETEWNCHRWWKSGWKIKKI